MCGSLRSAGGGVGGVVQMVKEVCLFPPSCWGPGAASSVVVLTTCHGELTFWQGACLMSPPHLWGLHVGVGAIVVGWGV